MALTMTRAIKLASDHAQWFLELIKPLLRTYMEHGYKHGWDDAQKVEDNLEAAEDIKPPSVSLVLKPIEGGIGYFVRAVCSTQEKAEKVISWYDEVGAWGLKEKVILTNIILDDHSVLREEKKCKG